MSNGRTGCGKNIKTSKSRKLSQLTSGHFMRGGHRNDVSTKSTQIAVKVAGATHSLAVAKQLGFRSGSNNSPAKIIRSGFGSDLQCGTEAEQKTAQMQWYVYSPGTFAKATFGESSFRTMPSAFNAAAHITNARELYLFIRAEF